MPDACTLRVRGLVQGVGFRPFVSRLAAAHRLAGWVRNAGDGVEIHVEGATEAIGAFAHDLRDRAPVASRIIEIEVCPVEPSGLGDFLIRDSVRSDGPTTQVSPDLPVCNDCLSELFDDNERRFAYPYINCTNCGPRFSIIHGLPYDRPRTVMAAWAMCASCEKEYHDAEDRRFHAQPIACPRCGPRYHLIRRERPVIWDAQAIAATAGLLREGAIVAIKGLGGYHLVCDARNTAAVRALRIRKYRKSRPFAIMAKDLDMASALVDLSPDALALLVSPARPIVLAPARRELPEVAPGHPDLGVMLPYTPLHHLLFAADAPDALVMTSGNRSNEPIAYEDVDASQRLAGIADAFLVGERRIARRVDDSVVRVGALGPVILRRARGYAPAPVARLFARRSVLAVGADLKNTITLVVGGTALVSQHIGDLEQYAALVAFRETARDLLAMYEVATDDVIVAHDCHPQYASTSHALTLPGTHYGVQHHRAHIASVLVERGGVDARVLGIAFDGTGYGDDGTMWGGEFFIGSVAGGFDRIACIRPALLPGGDGAARLPVQAAAGFLAELGDLPDLARPPFAFPARYRHARQLTERSVRTFVTTSAGRLVDAMAALMGFTRAITYEGEAAVWLEHLSEAGEPGLSLPFDFGNGELDYRRALEAAITLRCAGRSPATIARGFHVGLASAVARAAQELCEAHGVGTVVLSGGVFQNQRLMHELTVRLQRAHLRIWTNRAVPPNDGGISLGQAGLAIYADACATSGH